MNRARKCEPALTLAEWHLIELWNAGKLIGGHVPGYKVIEPMRPENKHKAAALALYGQLFGFAWADVAFLGEIEETCKGWWPGGAMRALELADRIAALLPPRHE